MNRPQHPSLSECVERVFERLALTYGRDFTDRYAGMDAVLVKAAWARELDGWHTRPRAVAYALDHLPSGHRPPTAIDFRDLCNRAPELNAPRLPAPTPTDRERVARMLAHAKEAVVEKHLHDPAARAEVLQARADAGEVKLTQYQRDWIRRVLASGA
jgi:hypothetical protein